MAAALEAKAEIGLARRDKVAATRDYRCALQNLEGGIDPVTEVRVRGHLSALQRAHGGTAQRDGCGLHCRRGGKAMAVRNVVDPSAATDGPSRTSTWDEQLAAVLLELRWRRPDAVADARAAVQALAATRQRLAAARRGTSRSAPWSDAVATLTARCGFVVDGWLPIVSAADPVWSHQHSQALGSDLTELAITGACLLDQLLQAAGGTTVRRTPGPAPTPSQSGVARDQGPAEMNAAGPGRNRATGDVPTRRLAPPGDRPVSAAAVALAETAIIAGVVAILCWLAADTLRPHPTVSTTPTPTLTRMTGGGAAPDSLHRTQITPRTLLAWENHRMRQPEPHRTPMHSAAVLQPPIRAVVIDFAGTIAFRPMGPLSAGDVVKALHAVYDWTAPPAFPTALRRIMQHTARQERATMEQDLFAQTLDAAARASWTVLPAAPDAAGDAVFDTVPDAVVDGQAADAVRPLDAWGYRLVLASNTRWPLAARERTLKAAGILDCFDTLLLSSELGVRIPHDGFFTEVLRAADHPAEQVLVVGDRAEQDVEPPRARGMRAVLISPVWRRDTSPGTRPPLFAELPRLLRATVR